MADYCIAAACISPDCEEDLRRVTRIHALSVETVSTRDSVECRDDDVAGDQIGCEESSVRQRI
jgi:hypothetical protein